MAESAPIFEGWAILELMGHRKLGGYVREAQLGGAGVIRIDVHLPGKVEAIATQFYSPGAFYCLTPVSEDVARRFAQGTQPAPVAQWELPAPREPSQARAMAELARAVADGEDDEEDIDDPTEAGDGP